MLQVTSTGESLAKVNIISYICKKLMILKAMIDKNVSLDLMALSKQIYCLAMPNLTKLTILLMLHA